MDEELNELKRTFIIDAKSYAKERIPVMVKRLLPFCRITPEGTVYFTRKDLTHKNRIKLALTARFLGSKLDDNIPPYATGDELAKIIGMPNANTNARISEALADGEIMREQKNKYAVIPAYIEKILEKIEAECGY